MQCIETLRSTLDHLNEDKGLSYVLLLVNSSDGQAEVISSDELQEASEVLQTYIQENPVHCTDQELEKCSGSDSFESTHQTSDSLLRCMVDLGKPESVTLYLQLCFKAIQQSQCKVIAKSWIRAAEPKKQARYPYKSGDQSKPPWWPHHVRHKEPDHLLKEERTDVMIALCRTHVSQLPQLKAASQRGIKMSRYKWQVMDELFRVIEAEARFKDQGIGPSNIEVLSLDMLKPKRRRVGEAESLPFRSPRRVLRKIPIEPSLTTSSDESFFQDASNVLRFERLPPIGYFKTRANPSAASNFEEFKDFVNLTGSSPRSDINNSPRDRELGEDARIALGTLSTNRSYSTMSKVLGSKTDDDLNRFYNTEAPLTSKVHETFSSIRKPKKFLPFRE
ncbi:unnamed protein product [Kuraishia capsulata CBS 1993]|uniref:Subtelomeric hrmA-associated cluster protein AFUB-079030/YDR124W-like helical bundle domain-containing protein n=1 Tax=Kuraishia capsulata CBS 1993 TaxID=1382522 RepID=W6MQ64_9ASCO|nr:uncharacterized protein KUCA_T00004806001 [Kuraishia capsulata CBS 1993]CDK28821.1 unnamed protein product [Kuraishia capsulata CBS 1993]